MSRSLPSLCLLFSASLVACGGEPSVPGDPMETDDTLIVETDTEDSTPDTEDTDVDTELPVDTAVVDTDTPVDTDTDTDSPVDTDTDSPVDTDTDSPVDTDTDNPVDTDTDNPVDTDTDTDTDSPPSPVLADAVFYSPWMATTIPSHLQVASSTGSTFATSTSWQPSTGAPSTYAAHLGDVDGDGLGDIVLYQPSSAVPLPSSLDVMLSTGTSFTSAASWSVGTGAPGSDHSFLGDVDGDGLQDLVLYTEPSGYTVPSELKVMLSTGSSFTSATSWMPGTGVPSTVAPLLFDANGDGLQDLVLYSPPAGYTVPSELKVLLSNGTSFDPAVSWKPSGGAPSATFTGGGDVNGDGLDDLILYSPAVGYTTPSVLKVMLSNGTSFDGAVSWKPATGAPATDNLRVADITGDGLADLVLYSAANGTTIPSKLEVMVSTGSSFGSASSWKPSGMPSTTSFLMLGDVDGQ